MKTMNPSIFSPYTLNVRYVLQQRYKKIKKSCLVNTPHCAFAQLFSTKSKQ